MKTLAEKRFLKGFLQFFRRLHNATTGSREVCHVRDVSIYETGVSGETVRFYLFFGNAKGKTTFFPECNDAYCSFTSQESVITITYSNGESEDFLCAFGYILETERLLQEFRKSEKSRRWAEWVAVDLWSHEIRHEFQLIRDLPKCHTRLPFATSPTGQDVCWKTMQRRFGKLYRSYIKQNLLPHELAREMDSISTSYIALRRWQTFPRHPSGRMRKIAKTIQGGL